MQTLELPDRTAWRAWLAEHHNRETEIWLVFHKKSAGIPSIAYGDALDEALCYGWVDSLIKTLDEHRYARKFTPRKDNSTWSLVNKQRAEALIRDGLMTEHGLRKIEAAKRTGKWDTPTQRPQLQLGMPTEFAEALHAHPQAEATFNALPPSQQKPYLTWILTARRPETRAKRIAESIQQLSEGKALGLRG